VTGVIISCTCSHCLRKSKSSVALHSEYSEPLQLDLRNVQHALKCSLLSLFLTFAAVRTVLLACAPLRVFLHPACPQLRWQHGRHAHHTGRHKATSNSLILLTTTSRRRKSSLSNLLASSIPRLLTTTVTATAATFYCCCCCRATQWAASL
jgi:hypothetical protein